MSSITLHLLYILYIVPSTNTKQVGVASVITLSSGASFTLELSLRGLVPTHADANNAAQQHLEWLQSIKPLLFLEMRYSQAIHLAPDDNVAPFKSSCTLHHAIRVVKLYTL
jgi:hypothetical protein